MNDFDWVDDSGISWTEVCKHMGFSDGNCFKYLYRAGQKGDTLEDLKKALWYAEDYRENENYLLTLYRTWKTKKKIKKIARSRCQTGRYRISLIMEKIAIGDWERTTLELQFLIEEIELESSTFGYSKMLMNWRG